MAVSYAGAALAGCSASAKPNFVWNTAMLKLMTVFLGDLYAIPGAAIEFFFGPSPAILGRSFGQREAMLRKRWPHPTFTHTGSLTMTYSHMGKPHTTIGAEQFHF